MPRIATLFDTRLDVRDLRVVSALASAGTTARAAGLLHLTQPAVSRALLLAEEKIGVALFTRTPRGLVLTDAGRELTAGAERVMGELADLERRVREPIVPAAPLRLVCECYTAYHWLPSVLGDLTERLPGLSVKLAIEHRSQPVPGLLSGELDVALLTTSVVPRGALSERPLFADEVVFAMSPRHPLAKKRTLTPSDLTRTTLLSTEAPDAEVRWFVRKVFGKSRPRLSLLRFPLTEAIIDMARAGMGVALLSEWLVIPQLERGDLVHRRLAAGPLERPWRIAYRPEVEARASRLASALRARAPRAPEDATSSRAATS